MFCFTIFINMFLHSQFSLIYLYIFFLDFIHMDIRPANILLKPSTKLNNLSEHLSLFPPSSSSYKSIRSYVENLIMDDYIQIKIGDLGLCRHLQEKHPIEEGESRYLSKELLDSINQSNLDLKKCDIFSLGCSIFELCLGRSLKQAGEEEDEEDDQLVNELEKNNSKKLFNEWQEIRNNNKNLSNFNLFHHYSDDFVQYLMKIMSRNPIERPTAQEILIKSTENFNKLSFLSLNNDEKEQKIKKLKLELEYFQSLF